MKKKPLNILLMSSHTNILAYDCPHIGLYRLQHLAIQIGHKCDVLDASLHDLDEKKKNISPGKYDLVGFSVSHNEMAKDLETIAYFKSMGKDIRPLVIAGGQEATYNALQWLTEGVDMIFTGYAEKTFLSLLQHVASRGKENGLEASKGLQGVMYLEDNLLMFNHNLPMTKDEFDSYNHDVVMKMDIPYERYWGKVRKESNGLTLSKSTFVPEAIRLYTSSHCPYTCGFCSSNDFLRFSQDSKPKLFTLDAKQIYEQIIHHIDKYGARCIMFNDDEFLLDKPRANELASRVIRGKADGEIPKTVMFNCQGRVTDFLDKRKKVDQRFIRTLVGSGFHSVGLGIETFSDEILFKPSINKKGYNYQDAYNVIESMKKNGLIPHTFTIIFIPEATSKDIKKTIRGGMEVFRNGGQIVVNPLLRAQPGARIYNTTEYPISFHEYLNPHTGNKVKISDHYIPHDPFLRECSEKFETIAEIKIEEFKKRWTYGKMPKSITGMLYYITAAKLMGDDKLAQEAQKIIEDKISTIREKLSSSVAS